jgi:hypothetical protein
VVKAVIPTFSVWDTFLDYYNSNDLDVSFLGREYNALMEAPGLADLKRYRNSSYFGDPTY